MPSETKPTLTTSSVRLSELFTLPDLALVIYHLMFGKKQTKPGLRGIDPS